MHWYTQCFEWEWENYVNNRTKRTATRIKNNRANVILSRVLFKISFINAKRFWQGSERDTFKVAMFWYWFNRVENISRQCNAVDWTSNTISEIFPWEKMSSKEDKPSHTPRPKLQRQFTVTGKWSHWTLRIISSLSI